jgi:hypothetical protein
MDEAHLQAVVTGALSLFWFGVSVRSFWIRRRTGHEGSWRWSGLALTAFCLNLMVFNLNGYVFGRSSHGPVRSPSSQTSPAASHG